MSDPHARHRFECRLVWTGAARGPTSTYEAYSREYTVAFEGKATLTGSSAPVFRGDPALHNPEDLLVAALSSCHCLSYLALCARAGIHVLAYEDQATGVMGFVDGKLRFTDVLLRPVVTVAAGTDAERARTLHTRAHAECFIASSVAFPVRHEPVIRVASDTGARL